MSNNATVAFTIVVVIGLYVLLFWGVVRWLRHRLLKRAELAAQALEARGATILGVRPSPAWFKPAEVEMEMAGHHAFFRVRRYGRDFILISVAIDAHPLPAIWIRPEKATERLGKAMGLHREVQLGDPVFDDAAFIASNAPDDVVKETLAAPEVRAQILAILALGYQVSMSPEGLYANRIQLGMDAFDPAPIPAALAALAAMLPALPRLDSAKLTHAAIPRQMTPVFLAIVASMIAFGVFMSALPSLTPPLNDLDAIKAMGLGIIPWLLVVFLLARMLRGRPQALIELVLTSAFSLVGVCAFTAAGLFLLNARLDPSPAETHATKVLSVASRDHEARVVPWDPSRTWQKVGLPRDVHRGLRVGDMIAIDLHPGALGWPWASAVRKVTTP